MEIDFMSEDHENKLKPIIPMVIELKPPENFKSQQTAADITEIVEKPTELPRGKTARRPFAVPHLLTKFPAKITARPHAIKAKNIKEAGRNAKSKRGIFASISDILFYVVVLMILLTVMTSGENAGYPKSIFGYSYFTVVSRSMQNEIPKGSLIFVKHTEPQDLTIGDTITYMRDQTTSVTHKIVDIYEDYENRGIRGFQTQGVNNASPDNDIVYETNVVGKVILVLPFVGACIAYLGANIRIVIIIFIFCAIISFCLRRFLLKKLVKKHNKIPA
jgi:signal peptidase